MEFTDKICQIRDPLDWTPDKVEIMVQACREMATFHFEHSPIIKGLYKARNFDPRSITSKSNIADIPSLGVHAMKYNLVLSMPEDKAVLKLTSSGTKGMKTQIWFDENGLRRVQRMLDVLWEQEGLISDTPTNFVMFSYNPKYAPDLGTAFTKKNQMRFAKQQNKVHYVLDMNEKGEWEFNKHRAINVLKEFQDEGLPVRLHGMPGFIHEIILELQAREEKIKLPPNSYMFTGGGWKAAEDKKVSRSEFRQEVEAVLGIIADNQRDGFGMAEHSAPYIECSHHSFHIPVYNRIIVRDPRDMKPLPDGETGLLEFVSPYNEMMPNLAILSTDLGYINTTACTCGRNSPTFTVVGRGGLTKHKGCAITASELVKRR